MKTLLILTTAATIALSSAAFAQSTGGGAMGQGAGSASGSPYSQGAPLGHHRTTSNGERGS